MINMSTHIETYMQTWEKKNKTSVTLMSLSTGEEMGLPIFKHKSRMFSESAASSIGKRRTLVLLAQISNQKHVPLMEAHSQKQQVQNSDINFNSDLFANCAFSINC